MSRKTFEIDLDETSPDDWEKFLKEFNAALDAEPDPQTAAPKTDPWLQYIVWPHGEGS